MAAASPQAPVKIETKAVAMLSKYPELDVVLDPQFTAQENVGGKVITKNYSGKRMTFKGNKATVNAEDFERIKNEKRSDGRPRFEGYGRDFIDEEELQRRMASKDEGERYWASSFVKELERHREARRMPPLTKQVLSF